jgi:TonB family protein
LALTDRIAKLYRDRRIMLKNWYISVLALAALVLAATPSRADDAAYTDSVRASIAKNVTYPRMAKMREQQGTVGYLVKIDASGAVADSSVETPSGVPSLDSATLDAIKAAAPFPAPPGGSALVHGNVNYKLN